MSAAASIAVRAAVRSASRRCGARLGAGVDVLGREEDHAGVDLLPRAHVARRRHGQQLLGRVLGPDRLERDALEIRERQPDERVGAASRDRAHELLDERPRERGGRDHDLPAGLDAERTSDEQLGELLDSRRLLRPRRPMIAALVSGWCQNYLAAAGVRRGERLRVVVDEPFAAEGEELAEAGRAAGAETWVARVPGGSVPLLEATPELLDSAAWADVSIGLLRHSYVEEQPARRAMLDALLSHGGRALSSSDIDHATLLGELSRADAGRGVRRRASSWRRSRVRASSGFAVRRAPISCSG